MTTRASLQRPLRLALGVWLACVLLGAAVLLVPEAGKRPLLDAQPWESAAGFFRNCAPVAGQLSPEFSRDERDYLRSWSPETGPSAASARSRPFVVPRFVAVPVLGYPAEPGIGLWLERAADGARLPLVRGNVHETWTERTLWLPGAWVSEPARLVARSDSATYYVGVGVPHGSSLLAWLKQSAFVLAFVHALTFLLLIAPGAALVSFLRGPLLGLPATIWVVPLTALIGYGAFYLRYYVPPWGDACTVAVTVLALAVAALRHRRLREQLRAEATGWPYAAMFAVSLAYVLLLYAADDGTGTWAATYRFLPAAWSSDNQLSQVVCEALVTDRSFDGLLSPWLVSDRPPLMTAIQLVQRLAWEPFLGPGSNRRLLFCFYQVAGIVASSLWVPALAVLARRTAGARRHAPWLVAFAACTGFFAFQTLYIWPKLLAGSLGLLAFVALYGSSDPDAGTASRKPCKAACAAAGVLAGLALLAHGGVVFGLLVAALALLLPRWRPSVLGLAIGAFCALALLLPWTAWQRIEDPPGNALVKSAFANTHGWGEEERGVLPTIAAKYRDEGWSGWLAARGRALSTVVAAHRPYGVHSLWRWPSDLLGELRRQEFAFLLPAIGLANLGWLALLLGRRRPSCRAARTWVLFALAGVAMNLLLTWHMHVVHHQSYLSLVLLFAALHLAISSSAPWARRAFLLLQLAYLLAVWVLGPFVDGAVVRWDHFVGFGLAAGAAALVLGVWSAEE